MTPSDEAPDPAQSDAAFTEAWQARAFAVAVLVSRHGCFTWSEWTRALGRELQGLPDGMPQVGHAGYFDCWLSALQSLLADKGVVAHGELLARKDAWEDAYRRTPHGLAVRISS